MSATKKVLRQLDEWRHLPDYQLERRVDIFFGMFLPKVIEKRFGVCVKEVIPNKMKVKEMAVTDFEVLTFAQFAEFLEDGNQPFESSDVSVFADYLRHWAGVEAGRVSPWPQQR